MINPASGANTVQQWWQARLSDCPLGYGFGLTLAVIWAYYGSIQLAWELPPPFGPLSGLTNEESLVASSFATGVLAQATFVALFILVFRNQSMIDALRSLRHGGTRAGWTIALLVTAVEILALYWGWIDRSIVRFESVMFVVVLTLVPAIDGLTQELFFRGFVMFRLRQAGFRPSVQILVSALGYASLHLAYGQDTMDISSMDTWGPFLGTLGFGIGLGVVVYKGKYRLLPAVCSHIAVLLAVQPWLAVS